MKSLDKLACSEKVIRKETVSKNKFFYDSIKG